MHLHAYAKVEEHDTIVETIVTAGYEKTAHRAGTGYCYEERDGDFICQAQSISSYLQIKLNR